MSRLFEPHSYFEPQPSLFKPMEGLADASLASGPAPRSSTAPLEQNSIFDRSQTHSTAPTSHRPKQDNSGGNGQNTSRRSSDAAQQELRDRILSRLRESEAGDDRPPGRSRSGSHSSASSIVSSVFRLLDHQTARANALEQSSQRDRDTLLNGMKEMRESRTRAETDLIKTRTELQMYKIRFEDIREELLRAQQLIDQLSKARDEAEAGWAKDREALRRISTEQMMEHARAEGRKEGWRQGIDRGRWLARLQRASYDTERRIVYEDEEDDEPQTPISFTHPQNYGEYDRPRSAAHHRVNRPAETRRNTAPVQGLASPRPVHAAHAPQTRPMTAPIRSPESIRVMNVNQGRPPSVLSNRRDPDFQARSPPQSVRSVARPASVAPSHRSHRSVEIPPDGYIPTLGPNARITLPPPHELTRPVGDEQTSPPARAPSVLSRRSVQPPAPASRLGTNADSQQSPRVRDYAYEESQTPATRVTKPVMPMHQYDDLFDGGDEGQAQGSPRSNDSWGSTRISDYDLISPPRNQAPSAIAAGKRREENASGNQAPPLHREDSQLSETQRMVEEWRSANSDVVSPTPQRRYMESATSDAPSRPTNMPSRAGPSRTGARPAAVTRRETGSSSTTNSTPSTTSSDRMFRSSGRADMRASIYTDGPSLFLGPFDSRPQSTAPSTSTRRRGNMQRSTSNATVPGIEVEPPSHSPTDSAGTILDPVLLTPDHAHQPLVFPSSRREGQHQTAARPKDPVIVADLPHGFVPLSPATPVPERDQGRATPTHSQSSHYGGIYG